MKLKIKFFLWTTVFLIFSIIFIYVVFKGNYLPVADRVDILQTKQQLSSSQDILSKLSATELKDYQGNKIKLDVSIPFKKTIIIHLWASWCEPCVNEIPELIAYSKNKVDTKFIIISLDENRDDITKFLKSFPDFNSERFIKIWDESNQLSKFLNADRLPMSIIINKDQSEPRFIRSVVDWKNIIL